MCWHDARGVFVGWSHEVRAIWVAAVIEMTQREFLEETPDRGSA